MHASEFGNDPLRHVETLLLRLVRSRSGGVALHEIGRTGSHYERLDTDRRQALGTGELFPTPGLAAEASTARWLWDHRVAAVAAENPALEAMPFDHHNEEGFLHYRLIPLLLNRAGGTGSQGNVLAIK